MRDPGPAVILALGAAIYVFDLKVEVFGMTFTAAEICRAGIVEPPAPLPTYPAIQLHESPRAVSVAG